MHQRISLGVVVKQGRCFPPFLLSFLRFTFLSWYRFLWLSILRWREIPPSFRLPLCLTQLESKPFTVLIILVRDAFTLVLASLLWVVATDYSSQFPFCHIPVEKSLFPSTFMPSSLSSSPMQSTWWWSDAVIMGEVISVKESKRVEWKNANFFLLLCLLFYWHASEREREFPLFRLWWWL